MSMSDKLFSRMSHDELCTEMEKRSLNISGWSREEMVEAIFDHDTAFHGVNSIRKDPEGTISGTAPANGNEGDDPTGETHWDGNFPRQDLYDDIPFIDADAPEVPPKLRRWRMPELKLRLELEKLRLAAAARQAEEDRKFQAVRDEQERRFRVMMADGDRKAAEEERRFRETQAAEEKRLEMIRLELRTMEMKNSDTSSSGKLNSFKKKIEEFAGVTTMHGAPKIILAEHPMRRVIWLLVFFSSWGMFIYQTVLVCENYLSYPIKTNVEIVQEGFPFPAVTFCNHRGTNFYDAQEWLVERSKRSEFEGHPSKYETMDFKENLTLIYDPWTDLKYIEPGFRSNEFSSFIDRSAISSEEFFVDLEFKYLDHHLQHPEIKEINAGHFFKCYTITLNERDTINHDTTKITLHVGILSGSGMIPDKSKEEGYSWKSKYLGGQETEGVRVFFNQPGADVVPNHEIDGFDVPPGHEASFLVKVRNTTRMELPYGNCTHQNPFHYNESSHLEIPYRQVECERLCCNAQLRTKRGYVSMECPPLDDMQCWIDENKTQAEYKSWSYTKRWCNFTTEDEEGQSMNVTAEAFPWMTGFDLEDCPCYSPCNELEYDVSMSFAKWPRQDMIGEIFSRTFEQESWVNLHGSRVYTNYSGRFHYGKFVMDKRRRMRIATSGNKDKFKFFENYIRNDPKKALADIVRIEIKIANNKVTKTIESPLYTPTQLLSEVGGQLGIWIGISVITLSEVIELVFELIKECFRRRKLSANLNSNDKRVMEVREQNCKGTVMAV